ncbi:peptidyl-tRNA hydrolase ICT1, mitochondrial isoform X2 [Olea europaea var. sylvestris]|uniref:peptidyl-tRNA hydrolase ICT1, mitochondrial isoform X2 n=1 Tax=Olea europaea var. sylvestris TaxID=158386 RepID=UPI000C1CE11F|nr:peptidyl-tRNA hydrolase ICT1, mitochondrial isoform X2 [Olea europaea var. sylvestris]
MAAIRATTSMFLARSSFRPTFSSQITVRFFRTALPATSCGGVHWRAHSNYGVVRCASSNSGGEEKKTPARLAEVQRLLHEAEERFKDAGAGADPVPRITLDHVTVSYARSGGPGGQNVNKVNTKVDMRFNVKNAYWLSDRVRDRIMQKEKNRINKDGELVISSTKTRTQKGNIEDALAKLQVLNYQKKKLQAIIEAASYVPPPPSEATVKKIAKLSAIGEQKRLDKKKAQSQKKSLRRSRDSWD